MGEFAKYKGHEIKIGTCQNMYYLRWEQRYLVDCLPGNVDPITQAGQLWFRLPRTMEDGVAPGNFEYYGFGGASPIEIKVSRYSQLKADIDEMLEDETHLGTMELRNLNAGMIYNMPCNHGRKLKEMPENVRAYNFEEDTLCITAVSVRPGMNGWQAVAKIACKVCKETLFTFTLKDLNDCQPYYEADSEDFNRLLGYMQAIEQTANNEESDILQVPKG